MSKPPDCEDRCTCDEYNWESHTCPFSVEIHDDYDECNCCPYCEQNCWDNI